MQAMIRFLLILSILHDIIGETVEQRQEIFENFPQDVHCGIVQRAACKAHVHERLLLSDQASGEVPEDVLNDLSNLETAMHGG